MKKPLDQTGTISCRYARRWLLLVDYKRWTWSTFILTDF